MVSIRVEPLPSATRYWNQFILHHLAASTFYLSIWHSNSKTHGSVCEWGTLQSTGESSCFLLTLLCGAWSFPFSATNAELTSSTAPWSKVECIPILRDGHWSIRDFCKSTHDKDSNSGMDDIKSFIMFGVDSIDIPIVYPSYTHKVSCFDHGTHPLPQPKRNIPSQAEELLPTSNSPGVAWYSDCFCCCTPSG